MCVCVYVHKNHYGLQASYRLKFLGNKVCWWLRRIKIKWWKNDVNQKNNSILVSSCVELLIYSSTWPNLTYHKVRNPIWIRNPQLGDYPEMFQYKFCSRFASFCSCIMSYNFWYERLAFQAVGGWVFDWQNLSFFFSVLFAPFYFLFHCNLFSKKECWDQIYGQRPQNPDTPKNSYP